MSYFCVEPYVHVKVLSDKALFCNYVDNNKIICTHELVVNFTKKLISYENSFVCNVTEEDLECKEIRDFIQNMRDRFMGDYLNRKYFKEKPIQFYPVIKTLTSIEKILKTNPLQFLSELTVHLNGSLACSLENAHNQFIYPLTSDASLSMDKLVEILKQVEMSKLSEINIIANFKQINVGMLTDILIRESYKFNLYTLEEDFDENILRIPFHKLHIIFSKISERRTINEYLTRKNVEGIFIAKNSQEYESLLEMLNLNNCENFRVFPYYCDNMDFFKDFVYINDLSFECLKTDKKEVDSCEILNSYFFGKLVIAPDLNVFSSFNSLPLNNLCSSTIAEGIKAELEKKDSNWLKTRDKNCVCSNCLYSSLCPPISNYELFLKRMNLCTIKL